MTGGRCKGYEGTGVEGTRTAVGVLFVCVWSEGRTTFPHFPLAFSAFGLLRLLFCCAERGNSFTLALPFAGTGRFAGLVG